MAKKIRKKPKATVENLKVVKENISKTELLRRIPKRQGERNRTLPLESKILILKLLHLNEMDYTKTSREVDVDRTTLYSWNRKYGDALIEVSPAVIISEHIDNDLDALHKKLVIRTYNTAINGMEKLDTLIGLAKLPSHIRAVTEAVAVTAELIKLDRERGTPMEDDFAKGIIELIHLSAEKYGKQG